MDGCPLLQECRVSAVFRPAQKVGEKQHEMNQQLVWIKQPREVYSNLKWFEEKRSYLSTYRNPHVRTK